MKEFIERLQGLELLSQNSTTMDQFTIEYGKLLGELMGVLKCMRALGAIQAAYLEAQAAAEPVQ